MFITWLKLHLVPTTVTINGENGKHCLYILVIEQCQGMLTWLFFASWSGLVWFYSAPIYTAILPIFMTNHTKPSQDVLYNRVKQ